MVMNNANKEIVRRKFEALSEGRLAALEEAIGEEIVSYDPSEPGPLRGRDAYRAGVESYLKAFPGMRARIDDQIAEGDKVVTRWTVAGRQDGELFGLPATGKEVAFTGIDIHRIANGRIVEEWTSWDALGLMRQLGLVSESEE
jgi:steroid delta-isomerase-like uncharacterized protein